MFVYTVEIKGNQNVLVTLYKNLFCVQQKNSFGRQAEGEAFLGDKNALLSLLHLS